MALMVRRTEPFPVTVLHTLTLLLFSGCSTDVGGLALVPVRGTVTLDDEPLAGASVTFVPQGDTRGSAAAGWTDAAGEYELLSGDSPGAPLGRYRVVISRRLMPDGSAVPPHDPTPPMESPARETLPSRYSDFIQSQLTADVGEGGRPIDFALNFSAP